MAALRGLSLQEVMEKTTEREYRVWMAWMDEEWNNPGRLEWYLMSLTSWLVNVNAKDAKTKPKDFKLAFDVEGSASKSQEQSKGYGLCIFPEPPKRLTKEDIVKIRAAESKATWARRMGNVGS